MLRIFGKWRVFFFACICLILAAPGAVFAQNLSGTDIKTTGSTLPSESGLYKNYAYVIDGYKTDISVHKDNSFDVTETIVVYFNKERHGIYRKIPISGTVKRSDGTFVPYRANVTSVSVNNEFETDTSGRYYIIKIGSADSTVTGRQTYKIHYQYYVGKDKLSRNDEFYYNIIGTEWDTVIGNVSFSIQMPSAFDKSKLGFSAGNEGTEGTSNVSYQVSGTKITGKYDGILAKENGLTVRLTLPDGYFETGSKNTLPTVFFMVVLPLVFVGFSYYLWYRFGRDDKPVETVEFYPPEGYNSLEIGYFYKGHATDKDVVSLMIYLANKGYIRIEEREKKVLLLKEKDFKIIKVKDYDGENENERLFLEGLFTRKAKKKGDGLAVEVTAKDLTNHFYKTMEDILENMNSKTNRSSIFEGNTAGKAAIVILMAVVTVLLIGVVPSMAYSGVPDLGMTIFALGDDSFYLSCFLVGLGCVVAMIVAVILMPKRTGYGTKILGQIKGFRHFLETAEKEKLEMLVSENPTYFYDILPYTYVLGVSDKWIKKFEVISVRPPEWYGSNDPFNMVVFGVFLNHTLSSARSEMLSQPQKSSPGGGFSGGGFSGGGFGGGGGGSW